MRRRSSYLLCFVFCFKGEMVGSNHLLHSYHGARIGLRTGQARGRSEVQLQPLRWHRSSSDFHMLNSARLPVFHGRCMLLRIL